ncbi:MAG: zinc ribbon domain-containing protein [Methanobacterium sp.]
MVSIIYCPRCKTKNSKKAEICYSCKKPLKGHKNHHKWKVFSFNRESLLDFKIIALGTLIFVFSNIIILDIAYDYSILVSGFATMTFLYFVFKNSPKPQNSSTELKSMGIKIIGNYLIMALAGILILFGLGFGY